MADNALREMVAAYAAGCLDKENYKQFKNYLAKGGKLPGKDLSEMQNIVSLIPLILELEKPAPKVKDAVARKLLSYQGEIKAKIKERKEKGIKPNPALSPKGKQFNLSPRTVINTAVKEPTEIKEDISTKTVADNYSKEINNNREQNKLTEENSTRVRTSATTPQPSEEHSRESKVEEAYPRRTNGNREPQKIHQEVRTVYETKIPNWVWLLFIGVIFASIVVLFVQYKNNSALQKKLVEAKTEQQKLITQNSEKENELYSTQILLDFLNKEDIEFVKLSPSDLAMGAHGKLFISFTDGEGLLEVNNLPPIEDGQVYHLWIISQSKSYSVLAFLPDPEMRFVKIPKLPYVPDAKFDLVRITVENSANSTIPEGRTYLYGAIKKN